MSQSSRPKVETLLLGFGMFAKLSGFQMLKPIGGAQTKSATALVWYFSNIQPETREQNGPRQIIILTTYTEVLHILAHHITLNLQNSIQTTNQMRGHDNHPEVWLVTLDLPGKGPHTISRNGGPDSFRLYGLLHVKKGGFATLEGWILIWVPPCHLETVLRFVGYSVVYLAAQHLWGAEEWPMSSAGQRGGRVCLLVCLRYFLQCFSGDMLFHW